MTSWKWLEAQRKPRRSDFDLLGIGMGNDKFYIIDGSSYVYRAYFAIRELSNSAGLPTNAVYGFTQMLLKIIKDKKPDYLAIAFDSKGPTFRHTAYPDYKAHRPVMPDPLALQIPYIHRMVEAFRIPAIMGDGYEADDLIGTLAKKGEAKGLRVVIVTGDKDMFQLVSSGTSVYDTMKEKHYTEKEIREKFGVAPAQVVEIMGLMGDSADNIPGVKGIGEKTAIQLIQQFGTVENLLSRLDEIKKQKLRQNLEAEAETARLSRSLALIDTACPIDFEPERFRMRPPDFEKLIPLCNELEFPNLLKGFTLPAPKLAEGYRILLPSEVKDEMAAIEKTRRVAIEILTTSAEPMRAEWAGIAFCAEAGAAFYLPLDDRKELPPEVRGMLESKSVIKVGHDLKLADIVLGRRGIHLKIGPGAKDYQGDISRADLPGDLAGVVKISPNAQSYQGHDSRADLLGGVPLGGRHGNHGAPIRGGAFDTMIASYLLNPGRRDHSLETVALEYLKERLVTASEAAGGAKQEKERPLHEAGADRIAPYLCQRADAIYKLASLLPRSWRNSS